MLHLLQHARIREIVGCRFELNHSQNPINRFPLIVFEPHDWMLPGQLSSLDFFRFHASAGREFAMNNENIASIAVERLHQ